MKQIQEYLLAKGKTEIQYGEPPFADFWEAFRAFGKNPYKFDNELKLWHDGKMKFNIKLWKDAALVVGYKYCMEQDFKVEMEKLEEEANRRGWTIRKIDLDVK